MDLCNRDVIREVLSRHGFHFSKSLGQNFLTENWVPERIAQGCGVDADSAALEVGPGMSWIARCFRCWKKRWRNVTMSRWYRAMY